MCQFLDVLDDALVTEVLDAVWAAWCPDQTAQRLRDLQQTLRTIEAKIANLTTALESGGADLASLVARLRERQQERDQCRAAMAGLAMTQQQQRDRARIDATVRGHIARWRQLLAGSVSEGRQLLREVLTTPLVFTPTRRGFRFEASVCVDEMIAGEVGGERAHLGTSPTGTVERCNLPFKGVAA